MIGNIKFEMLKWGKVNMKMAERNYLKAKTKVNWSVRLRILCIFEGDTMNGLDARFGDIIFEPKKLILINIEREDIEETENKIRQVEI